MSATDATYVVEVDLEQLRAHRSKAERREMSSDDVKLWLTRLGFYRRPLRRRTRRPPKTPPTEIRQARAVGNILH
jgi:hypothetical protein